MLKLLGHIPVALQVIGLIAVLAGIWVVFGIPVFLLAGGALVTFAGTVAEFDQRSRKGSN